MSFLFADAAPALEGELETEDVTPTTAVEARLTI